MKIAEGSEDAFEQIFHHYVPQVEPVIASIVKEELAVKDVIQEIFMSFWIGREKAPEIRSVGNWIFKMAYHRSYSWLRRKRTRDAYLREQSGDEPVQETGLFMQQTLSLIREAVDQLPAQAKRIYLLSREEGLTNSQIAGRLGLSVQTVKNSLVRSLKAMKEFLARHGIIIPMFLLEFFLNQ